MAYGEFVGRTAVVTGGSDGLGFDFCKALVEEGCEVFFCARNKERGEAAEAKLGEHAHYIHADLSVPADVAAFAAKVEACTKTLDYVVNNVAVDDRVKVDNIDSAEADRMWALNTRSAILVTRAFLPLLRLGAGKSIVNIGTTNYLMSREYDCSLYGATKAALLGFTRTLARDLGSEGIRVNMVSPGWIMTEKQLRAHLTPEDKVALLKDQCLKSLLYAEHVAPAVLFMLSNGARAITGQNLVVDGGKFMY